MASSYELKRRIVAYVPGRSRSRTTITEVGFGTPLGTGTLFAALITASMSSDSYSTIWMYSATVPPLESALNRVLRTAFPEVNRSVGVVEPLTHHTAGRPKNRAE